MNTWNVMYLYKMVSPFHIVQFNFTLFQWIRLYGKLNQNEESDYNISWIKHMAATTWPITDHDSQLTRRKFAVTNIGARLLSSYVCLLHNKPGTHAAFKANMDKVSVSTFWFRSLGHGHVWSLTLKVSLQDWNLVTTKHPDVLTCAGMRLSWCWWNFGRQPIRSTEFGHMTSRSYATHDSVS